MSLAGPPTWKEIDAAAQAADFAQLEGWVKESGIDSELAADALIAGARSADRSLIERLLALGVSPNATNIHGLSALGHVAENGQTEMARLLLQHGANPNVMAFCGAANCKGHTPLLGAVCKQNVPLAKMLLEAGADPRAADQSAIQTANENGDVELFLLLRKFGAEEKIVRPSEPSARSADDPATGPDAAGAPTPLAALGLTELLTGKTIVETSPSAGSKGRLSIIADDANVAVADLLAARLSRDASLELVERQELDRVLSEQKLARQFAADAAHYSQVAGLLRADALLLINLRRVAGRNVVESRLIRVNPGLALDTVYTLSPIASPAVWTERMAARISGLAAKVTRRDAIALSLLNIRASVSSAADRGLDRTLAVLLNDRLAHQPHFVLLERAAMERVASENSGAFWTGSYLVDGTLEPALDGSGAFSLSIRFQPTGAGDTLAFTTTGRRSDPAAAVDDLLNKVNRRLAASQSPSPRHLADEAQCYLAEAEWALDADQPALAQTAVEAARALGLHSLDVARLRVTAAMRTLYGNRPHFAARDTDALAPAAWLDLAIHALTVWRDTLDGELVRDRPADLRPWLELGVETTEGAKLALVSINTAAEKVKQADRLESLRELIWTTLQEARTRSAAFPPDSSLDAIVSEKQAAAVRLLFPRTARVVPVVRELLARHFPDDDDLIRARIRSKLLLNWGTASVAIPRDRASGGGSGGWRLASGDEAAHELVGELRAAPAPEDRYVAALLAIWTASTHREATATDLEGLRASLFDLRELLAQGGEIFSLYWDRFEALDKLNGVPFFAINRTYSPKGDHMWERHTPEHSEFRLQLYLGLCQLAKRPDPKFERLLAPDQFTAQQQVEVLAARSRLAGQVPGQPGEARGAFVVRTRAQPAAVPAIQAPPGNGAAPLPVTRLWHPFDLGLELAPEFEAEFGSMTWAEGRIWLHGSTLTRGGQPDRQFVFAIDPATMRTETFPLPERAATLNARFIVTGTNLVFALNDYLAVCDRATGRWDTYAEIKPAVLAAPLVVGDSLYLIVKESPGNALIAFNLRQRTTEVLASTRRRPAASPFDNPALQIKSIAANEAGEIVVLAGPGTQAWSPLQRTWRPVDPRSLGKIPNAQVTQYGRVGTVRQAGSAFVLSLNRRNAPRTEIPLAFARPPGAPLPESRYGPQNIRPEYCNAFAAGWILTPAFGSGFWVIPQQEAEEYLRRNPGGTRPDESARN